MQICWIQNSKSLRKRLRSLISFMVHLMSRLSPTLVKDTLKDFLYYRIENDSEDIEWAKNFAHPSLYHSITCSRILRGYQEGCKAFYLDL